MIKYSILGLTLISLVFTLDVNFSLETKYGDGSKVKGVKGEKVYSEYNFIENILDINFSFDNGLFVSTQLEYSDPPVFGVPRQPRPNLLIRRKKLIKDDEDVHDTYPVNRSRAFQ